VTTDHNWSTGVTSEVLLQVPETGTRLMETEAVKVSDKHRMQQGLSVKLTRKDYLPVEIGTYTCAQGLCRFHRYMF
jgi:hypothetical protein